MRRGAQWELQLSIWNKRYMEQGLAFVVRCHPEARMVKGSLIYAGTGPPDFMGVLQGGQTVAFDAKEVSGPRLPYGNIPTHQAQALDQVLRMGGVAFIAVQWMSGVQISARTTHNWGALGPRYWAWFDKQPGAQASSHRQDGTPVSEAGWITNFR